MSRTTPSLVPKLEEDDPLFLTPLFQEERAEKETKRDKVVREIIMSERSYVDKLGDLVEHIALPLEKLSHDSEDPENKDAGECQMLFGCACRLSLVAFTCAYLWSSVLLLCSVDTMLM